ncbi:MAG: sel1 repeat family protein, partial [Elusimicrobiales bacterium]|nr:sel1 repeat family protein [Elusimicrobiales bacterium]
MKKLLNTIKTLFAKISGKAKTAAAKAAETPETQEAAHTATTAMSESMPMSGINGKKILKTLLRNYFILIAGTLFSLSLFVIYKFSAKDGNVSANLKLADYYMTGIPYFLDKNPEKAEEQLRKFIEKYVDLDTPEQDNFKKDIINSIKNLNQLNETQIKPEKNNSQYLGINVPGISRQRALWLQKKDTLNCAAVSELKKDAEDKESDTQIISQRDIGGLYLIGECVEKDIKKAEEYLAKAAKKGDVKAKRNLGIIYLENYAKKEKDAFYLLLNAAENGDGIAQSKIGFMYLNKKNYDTPFYIKFSKKRMDLYRIKKAEYWLRRSAEQGLSEGEFGLGLIYLYSYLEELRKYGDKTYSEVILPDPAEAEKWFKKSADQGHPDSALALADMYHDGIGVPQQEILSFSLLEKLSEEGNESAELRIASLYHTGDRLIRKDDVEALRRFTLLSNKGNVSAKSYLANMYATGNGVSQNYDAAYKLYKNLITEHGEYINLLNIMILYEHIINDNVNNNILSYFNLRKEIYSFIEEEINLNEKKDV